MKRKKIKIQRLKDKKARQGKPTIFVGQDPNGGLYSILEKVSNMSFVEREKKMLKKLYINSDSEFDPLSLPNDRNANSPQGKWLYEDELRELKEKLAKKSKILRDRKNPGNVENLNQIWFMEDHLIASLNRLRNRKQQSRERDLEVNLSLSMKLYTHFSTICKITNIWVFFYFVGE
ncbi:hypothetical protein GOBAR_AA11771 [Gossypium barbadense]|uniref:MADS-box domain-containing protein n=1 Tax=Gossypium barbadense TaxID=3634 RepID=A0A2P5XZW0_GOSBA|nr:hypothetical protein GOBAR_AA11771 [Gossypium barbadense]